MRIKYNNQTHDGITISDDNKIIGASYPLTGYVQSLVDIFLVAGGRIEEADPPCPAAPLYKEKNSIIKQIIAAGKMSQVRALLNAPGMEDSKDLWDGAYKIAYDDAMVRQMLTTIGMNAETVMASATTFGSDTYGG